MANPDGVHRVDDRVVGNTAHRPRQNSGDHLLDLSGLTSRVFNPLLLLPDRGAFVRSALVDKPMRRQEEFARQRRKTAPIVEASPARASEIVLFLLRRRHDAPPRDGAFYS